MKIDSTDEISLQDAFKKFRKKKREQIKSAKMVTSKPLGALADHERASSLRKMFVNQALGYIGVPYAKRYHDKDSPDYDAPLFLDCCALVRRVLLNMKDELGFKIGRWNQGYQFDTLPITISKEEDMKPGDLVFISGTYFQPKRKKQKHDMVHVEIWLGDGEKTIGARYQKGRIQIHDSYKFVSKSYHNMVYHFKSIDTWLNGVCRSFCPEHAWKPSKYVDHGKHSIFAIADDSGSESAGDDDDDDDDHCNKVVHDDDDASVTSASNLSLKTCLPTENSVIQINEEEFAGYKEMPLGCVPMCNCIGDCTCSCLECSAAASRQETGNGIGDASYEPLSSDSVNCCCDGIKSLAPGDKSKTSRNSIGNGRTHNDTKSTSSSSIPRRTRSQSPSKSPTKPLPSVASSSVEKHRIPAPKFYIGGHNGVALVEKPLLDLGWKRIEDNKDLSYHLKWVECKSQIDYKSFKEGEQIVNHIPNGSCLTSKHGLLKTLQEYEKLTNRRAPDSASQINLSEFYPETYSIDSRQEIDAFCSLYKDGETWICKPSGMNQGKGIFLVRSLEQLRRELSERAAKRTRRTTGRVISRYLTNPLLLNGCKFDIRAYMLIASTTPYMVFYHPGYVRLSCVPFSNDSTDITAHLTNQYIQRKHPEYSEKKGETVWTFAKFNQYVEEHFKEEKGLIDNWVETDLTVRIKEIMLMCFRAAQNKLEKRCGYFDLLGFDFMVDENMKVWLIEINVNPALFTNCASLQEVIPGVVDETLKISIEAFENKRGRKRVNKLTSVKNFELLFDGERNATFRKLKVSQPRIHAESLGDTDENQNGLKIPETVENEADEKLKS